MTLDPVLIEGALCVGGRMQNAKHKDICAHPIILPKSHHVVDLVICQCHEREGLRRLRACFVTAKTTLLCSASETHYKQSFAPVFRLQEVMR